MKRFRVTILILSVLQVVFSLIFLKFGKLYFFNEERETITAVNELTSQGGGEDIFIVIGAPLFIILLIFNLLRYKRRMSILDYSFLFFTLLSQAFCLMLIEVASLKASKRSLDER